MMRWVVENGIGEERALLIENGQALAAAIRWPGSLEKGLVEDALLVSRPRNSKRGRARFTSGEEALVDRLPANASEGATIRLEITRPAMGEQGRTKLAQARPSDDPPRPALTLAEQFGAQLVRRFERDLWEEVLDEAWDGVHGFPGGTLHFSPTPAMTLVDVDGHLPPRDLAVSAAHALGPAIARFGLGGSIGVDFPTLPDKAGRKAVGDALNVSLAASLDGWNHERTAMNGFGFVQLVARVERPSVLHLLRLQPMQAGARLLLRRAEELFDPGAILLTAHPGVLASLRPEWLEELARRTGREVRTAEDPALAAGGGFAQVVPR